MKTKLDREAYVALYLPPDAVKVTAKNADAVAYIWSAHDGTPRAAVFIGKQSEPVWRYKFRDEAAREKAIATQFASVAERAARMAGYRAERKAWVPDYKVGDILNTCWGYDQTNREFFEVVAVKGKYVTLREIAQVREHDTSMSGRCMPQSGHYIGEPIRRLAQQHGVKIDEVRSARRWATQTVAGVPLGPSLSFSEWH
jgi:hypothetical protein